MTADPRATWADQLSVPADTGPDAVIAAFLRALPGDDFLPAPERAAAVNALAGASVPVGKDHSVKQLLSEETESFAARFWQLEPAERLTAWSDLVRRGAPAVRLRELEPGLDVAAPALVDPDAEELAALMRALFIMPPRGRAIRRNTWLAERTADADRWRAALASVARDAPGLAALDTQLRAALDANFNFAALIAAATTLPTRPAPARSEKQNGGSQTAPPHAPKSGRWGVSYTAVVIGLIVLVNLFRVVSRITDSGTTPTTRSSESSSVLWKAPPPAVPPVVREFTLEEVAEFQQYERDRDAGRVTKQPLNYAAWRLAGRPAGRVAITKHPEDRPVGGVAITKPPEGGRLVTFNPSEIVAFRTYLASKSGPPPPRFDEWVKVGKPAFVGTFVLYESNP
jgi:hypothetical protein